ncbi:MAG: hypothetical protein P4M12_10250 [Gammaproteobacteria bacterium]|nr:hypothetical protein [Gammaproteobacteria bacterium]
MTSPRKKENASWVSPKQMDVLQEKVGEIEKIVIKLNKDKYNDTFNKIRAALAKLQALNDVSTKTFFTNPSAYMTVSSENQNVIFDPKLDANLSNIMSEIKRELANLKESSVNTFQKNEGGKLVVDLENVCNNFESYHNRHHKKNIEINFFKNFYETNSKTLSGRQGKPKKTWIDQNKIEILKSNLSIIKANLDSEKTHYLVSEISKNIKQLEAINKLASNGFYQTDAGGNILVDEKGIKFSVESSQDEFNIPKVLANMNAKIQDILKLDKSDKSTLPLKSLALEVNVIHEAHNTKKTTLENNYFKNFYIATKKLIPIKNAANDSNFLAVPVLGRSSYSILKSLPSGLRSSSPEISEDKIDREFERSLSSRDSGGSISKVWAYSTTVSDEESKITKSILSLIEDMKTAKGESRADNLLPIEKDNFKDKLEILMDDILGLKALKSEVTASRIINEFYRNSEGFHNRMKGFNDVFTNDAIKHLSQEIRSELKSYLQPFAQLANPPFSFEVPPALSEKIGKVVNNINNDNFNPTLLSLRTATVNHERCLEFFKKLQEDPKNSALFSDIQKKSGGLTIQQILIEPIQYGPRYKMPLEAAKEVMNKLAVPDQKLMTGIDKAITKVSDSAMKANTCLNVIKNLMDELTSKLQDKSMKGDDKKTVSKRIAIKSLLDNLINADCDLGKIKNLIDEAKENKDLTSTRGILSKESSISKALVVTSDEIDKRLPRKLDQKTQSVRRVR